MIQAPSQVYASQYPNGGMQYQQSFGHDQQQFWQGAQPMGMQFTGMAQ